MFIASNSNTQDHAHTHFPFHLLKFLFPLNKALQELKVQYRKWAVTDLPPLKESRPEIP
jgi:hypothetical protein